MHWSKSILIGATAIALFPMSAAAQEQGFFFSLGAGVEYGPEYRGSDDYEASPFPFVELGYDFRNSLGTTITFAGTELGVTIWSTEQFEFGASLGYGGGRDASENAIFDGLSDIDDGLYVSAFASYAPLEYLSFNADVLKYTEGTEGLELTLGVSTGVPITDRLAMAISLDATYMDDNAAQGFFGVTAAQSASSTAGLQQYNAKAGFQTVDLSIDFAYDITKNITGIAGIGVSQLIGDAADSPFTKDEFNPSVSVGLVYNF